MKRNSPVYGFVLGALLPVVGLFIVYFILSRHIPFPTFLHELVVDHKKAFTVMSLSILANIVPFMLYTNRRLDKTARGILIATMIYAVFMILIKYVW